MDDSGRVLVLGGTGLAGSALVRRLQASGERDVLAPSRRELDLFDAVAVRDYFLKTRPRCVFLAAAKVGGIVANNTYRADFILENIRLQSNAFEAALKAEVPQFIFLGSSCVYPKMSPQPINEDSLLTSPLEETNEPYAIAKIAGLKTAESIRRQFGHRYFSVMPTNLYGPGDNYHPENSHVIPGLIRRMSVAQTAGEAQFKVWGSGRPKREFMYVDDFADACVFLMNFKGEIPFWINIGTGVDLPISELVKKIADRLDYRGKLVFDTTKPDGTPRKWLDVSKLEALGWKARIGLDEGLDRTIQSYLAEVKDGRLRMV